MSNITRKIFSIGFDAGQMKLTTKLSDGTKHFERSVSVETQFKQQFKSERI